MSLAYLKGNGRRDIDWVKGGNTQNTPMTKLWLIYALELEIRTSQNTKVALATPSPLRCAPWTLECDFRAPSLQAEFLSAKATPGRAIEYNFSSSVQKT